MNISVRLYKNLCIEKLIISIGPGNVILKSRDFLGQTEALLTSDVNATLSYLEAKCLVLDSGHTLLRGSRR
jgi:hypothetical protein